MNDLQHFVICLGSPVDNELVLQSDSECELVPNHCQQKMTGSWPSFLTQ